MKVTFKYGIGSFSGTTDMMVFRPTTNKLGSIGRKWVMPAITSNNTLRGVILKNLSQCWNSCASGYRADMKTYCSKWNTEYADPSDPFSPRLTSFGMFVRLLYKFSDLDSGHIDLSTITYTDLQTVATDIESIAAATSSGYLDAVSGAESLIATW